MDFDGLVQRFRDEGLVEERNFEDLGKANAGSWMNSATYVDLKYVAENSDPANMTGYRLPKSAFRTMKQDMAEAKADCEGDHAAAYKTAWLADVKSVWAQATDQPEDSKQAEPEPEPAA